MVLALALRKMAGGQRFIVRAWSSLPWRAVRISFGRRADAIMWSAGIADFEHPARA